MKNRTAIKVAFALLVSLILTVSALAATVSTRSLSRSKNRGVTEKPSTQRKISRMKHARRATASARGKRVRLGRRHHYYYERFNTSSFADGRIFEGDNTAGEDPIVRQAALDALGNMNGTVVAIDPSNGRVLAMVNQKLALSAG